MDPRSFIKIALGKRALPKEGISLFDLAAQFKIEIISRALEQCHFSPARAAAFLRIEESTVWQLINEKVIKIPTIGEQPLAEKDEPQCTNCGSFSFPALIQNPTRADPDSVCVECGFRF